MRKRRMIPACLVIIILLCSGCSKAPVWDRQISVALVDCPFVDLPEGSILSVPRHSDVTVCLRPHPNYQILSVNYPAYTLYPNGDEMLLTLMDVAYPTRIELECQQGDTVISYNSNGGTLRYATDQDEYSELYSLNHHLRPNTGIGTDLLQREGFTLTGWNTQPDGSGERVGLGSRVTIERGSEMTLYAQWAAWTDADQFHFAPQEDGTLTLTGCTGISPEIVVPERVGGKPVTAIGSGAFADCPAQSITLPASVVTVEPEAFVNCTLRELTFFDSLLTISDASFVGCPSFSTVHINAIQPPRYAAADRYTTYADKVDAVIASQGQKRIVLFGGSGTYYSLDACTLAQEFTDYAVFNLGVNAWFNAQAQMEILLPYLGDGDVLIHAPEMMSPYQFMAGTDMGIGDRRLVPEVRFFTCTELNYDLLSLIDLRHVTAFFDTYTLFNTERQSRPATKYTDYGDFADTRGDMASYRYVTVEKIGSISGEAGLDMSLVTDEPMSALNAYYDRFAARGCKVLRAFACENADGFTPEDWDNAETFSRLYREKCPYPVLNELTDVLYPTIWFCDTDWHLTHEYSVINTRALIPAIVGQIGG